MKNFFEYIKTERHIAIPDGDIPGSWFFENNLPMVVSCSCCGMTMTLPSAWIDDEGYTYCSDCAED